MGSGKTIRSAIQKHGISNFSKVILETFDSAEAMYARETSFRMFTAIQTYFQLVKKRIHPVLYLKRGKTLARVMGCISRCGTRWYVKSSTERGNRKRILVPWWLVQIGTATWFRIKAFVGSNPIRGTKWTRYEPRYMRANLGAFMGYG